MARSPTTSDAFNTVAEPRRRRILDPLARGERPVNDVVVSLGLAQPQVSKARGVLKSPPHVAHVKRVHDQARADPEAREISRDMKAKVALGDYARGGKNPDRR